ncbi:hypothetical protein G7K_3684-t1 [Saitoella complicata NRRL Y-17804]|uniref:Uncharacterized protein n=1 Tax=Saitoella complicata (strain BCRC 22490 / CBS 7301 / JCM 7358 / NBRC 10748 / NRRL Y-17804) TaxID=698492 RepID=A0A0E9NJF7_SAICN|nr:hypothetical protein G7K_3684-t1 [Saitoella complicata NRRL Y-17804]
MTDCNSTTNCSWHILLYSWTTLEGAVAHFTECNILEVGTATISLVHPTLSFFVGTFSTTSTSVRVDGV